MAASVFQNSEEVLRLLVTQNPQSDYGRAVEILKQIGELTLEEISKLEQRMNFLRVLLAVKSPRKSAEELHAFLTDLGVLPKPSKITSLKGDWLSRMVKDEVNAWQKFAGWKIDAEKFAETLKVLGKDRLEIIKSPEYNMEHGMLPDKVLTEDMDVPRWIKPGPWIWQQIKAGNICIMRNGEIVKLTEARLSGRPVLFDRRKKPAFNNGRQRWENDLLMEYLIEKLQQEGQLPTFDWCDRGSRFGLSRFDWAKVALRFDEAFEFSPGTFRLESWEEWSILSQYKSGLPRSKDGQTGTWVWFDQCFKDESNSLLGGSSVSGGFASVSCNSSASRWNNHSARLLGDLGSLVS